LLLLKPQAPFKSIICILLAPWEAQKSNASSGLSK